VVTVDPDAALSEEAVEAANLKKKEDAQQAAQIVSPKQPNTGRRVMASFILLTCQLGPRLVQWLAPLPPTTRIHSSSPSGG